MKKYLIRSIGFILLSMSLLSFKEMGLDNGLFPFEYSQTGSANGKTEGQELPPVVDSTKVRMKQIKGWYRKVQSIGLGNCKFFSKKIEMPINEEEMVFYYQKVQFCKINKEFEVWKGWFKGYEWGEQVNIYKRNEKIFFVFVDGTSENNPFQKRYYFDENEQLIQLLERNTDFSSQTIGAASNIEIEINPNKRSVQDNIGQYLELFKEVKGQ